MTHTRDSDIPRFELCILSHVGSEYRIYRDIFQFNKFKFLKFFEPNAFVIIEQNIILEDNVM